jgi:predicted Zn-dependent peptidase
LRGFFEKTYQPANLIITAAGNLRHDEVVRLVEERFGHLVPRKQARQHPTPRPKAPIVLRDKPSLEQVHLCLGLPACPVSDARRYAAYVLNTVLGGGFSSRLFLKVREREGLAYAIYSDLSLFVDSGCLTVYSGTSLATVERVLDYVVREFRDLKENHVPAEELRRAKDHLKGSLMLSLESTSSRMSNLARQEKYFGRFLSLDEISECVETVTSEQVRELAQDWFLDDRIAVAVLGNLNGFRIERDALVC